MYVAEMFEINVVIFLHVCSVFGSSTQSLIDHCESSTCGNVVLSTSNTFIHVMHACSYIPLNKSGSTKFHVCQPARNEVTIKHLGP